MDEQLARAIELRDRFLEAIRKRFSDQPVETREDQPLNIFIPAKHPETGGIELEVEDEDSLIFFIDRFAHTHFDGFTTEQSDRFLDETLDFLADIFADRVAFYGNPKEGGGWWYPELHESAEPLPPEPHFLWSGPMNPKP